MLKIKDVNIFYGNAQALKNISLEVNDGEVVAILGANGAGKSTLLKAVSGLLRPASGRIEFQNREINRLSPNEIVTLGISQCPEGRKLFPEMSVYKNLMLGGYIFRKNKKKIAETMASIFDLFPILYDRKEQMAGTLSGGEQQMLAIGRALMPNPLLLLLDETSLGLAPIMVEHLFKAIRNINETGITVLLVEQNAAKALEVSKRVYVLESGNVVISDSSENLLNDPKIKEAYLGI